MTVPRVSPLILAMGLLAPAVHAGGAPAAEPRAAERGFPLIRAVAPDLPEASTQNFDIAHDARGLLYVANGMGVLVYDGAWWRLVPVGPERTAYSIAVNDAGSVGVGGADVAGVLTADATGTLTFRDVAGTLPAAQRGFGQVMQVLPTRDGFLYSTTQYLFAWDGTRLRAVATFPGDRPYTALFDAGGVRYVWTRDGLARLEGERMAPIAGGAVFRGRRVDQVLPLGNAGDLLVSVRGEGLFRFAGGVATPFAPAVSRWAAPAHVYNGLALPDGRLALGSVLGGMALLRPNGEIDQLIDLGVGLPDDFVHGMTLDRDGSLWLALNNGLARLAVSSELSILDARSGLKGTVYDVTRHHGTLAIATAAGLFRLAPEAAAPARADRVAWGRPARIRAVPQVPPSAWSLLSLDDQLLVGTGFGLLSVGDQDRVTPIAGPGNVTIYALVRSRHHPERVYLGLEDGLATMVRTPGGWRYEGKVPGVAANVRTVVEDDQGRVYCGSDSEGLQRFDGFGTARAASDPPPAVQALGVPHGAVFRTSFGIVATAENGLLRLDETSGRFVEDPRLRGLGADGLDRLLEDARGGLWMNTTPVSIAERRGDGFDPATRTLVDLPAREVGSLYADADGVVWLGAETGLFRMAGGAQQGAAALPAPLLRGIGHADAPALFGGAPGVIPAPATLPAGTRRLRIEFAPAIFRGGLRFQTRLDPLDGAWGEPNPAAWSELTRLPADDYRFRVRTLGPNGETGPETTWAFRVLPPWYATRWAWALWSVLGLGLVATYGPLRHRALRQRATALEAQVAEKTAALRHTVDELEVANRRLQELSLSDDLTGIANRRRLQQRLDEEWSRARRHQLSIALAMLDLDEFKLLNDTRGHLEGDQCLQTVAAYLAEAVQRRGDVVARYGGEEFAVLLPNTDLAGVRAVAESLRAGVEALAIPHPHARGGRLTISIGYAACVPAPEESSGTLVAAADDALYRAKAAGRNRVEPAPGARTAPLPPA